MAHIDLEPPRSSRGAAGRRPVLPVLLVLGLVVGGVAAAGYWLGRREPSPAPIPVQPTAASVPAPAPEARATATVRPGPQAAPAPATLAAAPGPRRLSVTVTGTLEASIAEALGPEQRSVGAELVQVANRLLVWSLDVARDARSGDRLELLWSPAPPAGSGPTHSQEPVVEALRYDSGKLGKVISAYRYQAPGSKQPRYYDAAGTELEERLVDGPIREYEQITSLVKDGRHHKGVDFRTPVGTPVLAPFDGVIERRNWNFAGNGNCLDLLDPATGRHAIFLHLDVIPSSMATGRAVKKGEPVAGSGNSGHSTAPHLHYQLEDGSGSVLDPFKVHATTRASLPAPDRAAFDAERARLDARLAG
jgi:murein DD-endopeptidase MepM/ murein hydrolase activator NlpD